MNFFDKKQKELSRKSTYAELLRGYKTSEKALERAARTGDDRELHTAMSKHQQYEYALLYRKTPEYKRCKKK